MVVGLTGPCIMKQGGDRVIYSGDHYYIVAKIQYRRQVPKFSKRPQAAYRKPDVAERTARSEVTARLDFIEAVLRKHAALIGAAVNDASPPSGLEDASETEGASA